MVELKLSQKEVKLILGVLDTTKYDYYFDLWEFVEDKETNRLERKLLKLIKKG